MSSDFFMQPHQAKNVKWFDGNKTIGEMLDDGSMTIDLLQKGINSDNSHIKAACTILKPEYENQLKNYIDAHGKPRNLDEARAVVWPYCKRTQRPGWTIGQLLDAHIITPKDLNYAVHQYWNEQVYRACILILSDILNIENKKIVSGNGPLAISINRSSFMSEEGEAAIYKRGLLIGLMTAFWIVLFIGDIAYVAYHILYKDIINGLLNLNWIGWLIIILGVTFGSYSIIKILNLTVFRRIDDLDIEIKNHRLGQIGEDNVADALQQLLDGSCHIFRNYHVNGKKEDIDIILLSPWGIFAMEIKNWSGTFEIQQTSFYRKNGKKLIPMKDKRNPIKQIRGNAAELKKFLEPIFVANEQTPWVEPILIWANPNVTSYDSESKTKVWKIDELSRKIDSLKQSSEKIPDKCYKEIEAKLMKFYENN